MSAAGLGYCAAVTLAAIFATAGIAKLRDLRATLEQFTALGLPRPGVFTRIVPLAELALVTLLLIVPAVGAIFAMITLAFFTTFLVERVRAGVTAPCACFGATVSTPLSMVDVVRNAMLLVLAAASLMATRPVRPSMGISTIFASRHSMCTGDSATRGAFTIREGALVSPATLNSSMPWGAAVEESLILCISSSVHRLNTNSPVSRTLRRLSFSPPWSCSPLAQYMITGG